jgi:hypothetical protein
MLSRSITLPFSGYPYLGISVGISACGKTELPQGLQLAGAAGSIVFFSRVEVPAPVACCTARWTGPKQPGRPSGT